MRNMKLTRRLWGWNSQRIEKQIAETQEKTERKKLEVSLIDQ